MIRRISLAAVLLLAGCGYADMHEASTSEGALVGMSAIDAEECLGIPNRTEQLSPTIMVREFDNVTTSSKPAFAMTLPFGFSVAAGEPASCHMVETISDTGTVLRVEFTGLGVTSSPEACSQIVRRCIQGHADATSSKAVNTFQYLGLPKQSATSK